jgi:hypothetical protein
VVPQGSAPSRLAVSTVELRYNKDRYDWAPPDWLLPASKFFKYTTSTIKPEIFRMMKVVSRSEAASVENGQRTDDLR